MEKRFILGKGNFPTWFNDELAKGRVKVNRDDETQEMLSVTINSPTKRIVAYPGDTIMMIKSGITCISKERAEKYGLQKQNKKTV